MFRTQGETNRGNTVSSILEGQVALRPRFRSDSTTIILPSSSEELGILDEKTASALKKLKEVISEVKFQIFFSHEQDGCTAVSRAIKPGSTLPVQVNVYGIEQHLLDVGRNLSDSGMFLQEPIVFGSAINYQNPHFLCWDDCTTTPLFHSSQEAPRKTFMDRIEDTLNTPYTFLQDPLLRQDARVPTVLKRYPYLPNLRIQSLTIDLVNPDIR